MANVYVHSDYAVVSVMVTSNSSGGFKGATVYVRHTPFDVNETYPLSFTPSNKDSFAYTLLDFNVQDRFEANVVPKINDRVTSNRRKDFYVSNSNISVDSYVLSSVTTDLPAANCLTYVT